MATDDQFPPLLSAVDVTVGVVDTGVAVDANRRPHPWFADHLAYCEQDIDLLGADPRDGVKPLDLLPADGHGTFVAGLVLHQAPRARVSMWGVIDKDVDGAGDALGAADDVAVADAVRALGRDSDVQVINLSFGGGVFADEGAAGDLAAALASLDDGVAVVAAAGNDGGTDKVWPAAFERVIAVGALAEPPWTPADLVPEPAPFSNRGPWVQAFASGVQVLGPFVEFDGPLAGAGDLGAAQQYRGWARWSGTSFAAARVSGRVAQTAIELRVSGREAAAIVLRESRTITDDGAVWVRGRD